jgi:uncharacterized Zn finger protein
MPRETVDEKALRYIAERRVVILGKRRGAVFAEVQGSAASPYHVRYVHGAWRCSCPSSFRCCHITALEFVCPARAFGGSEDAA